MNYLKIKEVLLHKPFFVKCIPTKQYLQDSAIYWLYVFNDEIKKEYNETINLIRSIECDLGTALNYNKDRFIFTVLPTKEYLPDYVKEMFTEFT